MICGGQRGTFTKGGKNVGQISVVSLQSGRYVLKTVSLPVVNIPNKQFCLTFRIQLKINEVVFDPHLGSLA